MASDYERFKKILSYLWPLTQKHPTLFNGELEITWHNGKKLLNSKNANYSYGSLQKILEFGLKKIDLTKVNSVLILGLGGGSVVQSLRNKFGYQRRIEAVEIDEKVIQLAKHEFHLIESANLQIFHSDARAFVQGNHKLYDLIIIDLFIDETVPEYFYSQEFCKHLQKLLSREGALLFNLGINDLKQTAAAQVIRYFSNQHKLETLFYDKILGTNTLLLVRYQSVE